MALGGQTETHLYDTRDCRAHVRSRWLFSRTIPVSRRHVEPFHLHNVLATMAFCQGRRTLSYLSPSYFIAFPINERRLDLGCCLVWESRRWAREV
ncbi:hypothetical protein DM02DRAFT_373349 [Periconia macrospinosa]|uniref:Uncharacterized protein n=1 Tax=Periconia macrospinosa TaxID=97972 RepID=A0A2V1CZ90_9PLEO|nr:hypothetical protein DM02DRAFT_373349 [Periconia macrospinosa]